MDDLFDAFEESSAGTQLATALATAQNAQSKGSSAAAATVSIPSTAASAGKKRQREESSASSSSSAAHDASDAAEDGQGAASSSSSSLGLHHGMVGINAIDAAAILDLDAHRNEQMIEFEVRPPAEAAAGTGGDDSDADDSDEDASPAKASSAGAGTSKLAAGAGAGSSSSSSSAAPSASNTGLVPLTSVAAEIGDALKPRLLRGDIDESKTTAPDAPIALPADFVPAKTYPFTLDPFQRRSIECLERNESVLVSAHTSAGKTVVAEYAIAMALRDKQRVIYTSPIKALSNQKYRDLYEEFSDVGLMTGDVTINPNASCLVMTTEILRSMLYRGSEIMREVKWVIFDEIHYMRDRERGVVWEESIIMLPHKVRFVFLSATIPNAREFAEWVAKIHHQTCHVVYTDYRPTPLQHFIFPAGGDGVYMVVDEKGRFREDTFGKAMAALGTSALDDAVDDVVTKGGGKKKNMRGSKGKGGPSDLFKIIKMIMERNYDPVIVFSFSKRECEQYALQLAKLDFTSDGEKKLIEQVFLNAIDSLSEDDRQLPQIDAILPLLKRGIGIHHGGLLPILKEVIEILFQESLLKILFATETFSMGINMPARTVVFTASRKWDGTDFRWISAGEYIQMSGRAGRRGLDDRGLVIQMIDEKMEPAAAKDILKGTADPLNSAFHLGYNMLLNLLRMEGGDPERMMQLSFHQFQNERAAPAMEEELAKLSTEAQALSGQIKDEASVGEYFQLCAAMEGVRNEMRRIITTPAHALPFLQPGRLVRVTDGETEWGWGILVDFQRNATGHGAVGGGSGADTSASSSASGSKGSNTVVLRVLLHVAPEPAAAASSAGGKAKRAPPRPASEAEKQSRKSEFEAVPLLLQCVSAISSIRMFVAKDLKPKDARDGMADRLREVMKRFPEGPALLDPVADMQIEGPEMKTIVEKSLALQQRIAASAIHTAADRNARFALYKQKLELEGRCKFLKDRIKKCHALVMKDALRSMKRVLRRLGHVDASNVVQMKGRVSCEVNTADELLVTELIFTGAFNDLDAAQAASLLSCMVYTEKSSGDDDAAPLREELAGPLRQLQDAARRIAQVSQDCKIEVDPDEYVEKFNSGMMELVYQWVNGARFVDICALTKEFEGSIIRVIRRLEELTRQLADAAKAIGDEALEGKFREASTKMRRDIIFAASLYL